MPPTETAPEITKNGDQGPIPPAPEPVRPKTAFEALHDNCVERMQQMRKDIKSVVLTAGEITELEYAIKGALLDQPTELPPDRLPWSKLNPAQQIERLRDVVKERTRVADHVGRQLRRLEEKFDAHTHVGDRIVADINSLDRRPNRMVAECAPGQEADPWF